MALIEGLVHGYTLQFHSNNLEYEQFKESKPNPEIYLHTIKELNVNKDEAIIIEDSPKGILAANRAGIKVLALKDDKFGLDQSQADINIDELNDIIKLIEKGA